jgi:hypothetical protein
LDGKWKRKDNEVISEDGERRPKKAKVVFSKPLGSKPLVEILAGPSRIADPQLHSEMVELPWELVSGIQDLSKVTRGLVGVGVCMDKQNAELIRLRKRQVYLAEQARKEGLGLGSRSETEKESEGSGSGKDKGQGK